ncbi:MAG: hypothetical protein Q4B69_06580 [Slackia sp.]|nr:hypothetical protein [Slackia sp.]
MSFLLSVLGAFALAGPLARSLKHHPGAWYAAAALVVAAVAVSMLVGFSSSVFKLVFSPVVTGDFAFALFSLVMFTGAFRPGCSTRVRLMQIRQPLAIFACIMAAGHIVGAFFGGPVFFRMDAFAILQAALCVFLAVSCVVLGVTSPTCIVERMRQTTWRRIHALSYLFYPAVCVHAALCAAASSFVLACLYAACAIVYAAARLRRCKKDGGFCRR